MGEGEHSDPRWRRLDGVVDVAAMSGKHVIVVGLGSGGSTVAVELAKAGVGRFTLVDPDVVEPANLVRHECDDRYLGWNKAQAVADLIRHRNPRAEVEAVSYDLFAVRGRMERLIASADLVSACTDAEPPKHLLNRLSVAAGVAAVYGGVYERGTGGEVVRCAGGAADPCYACVASVLKDTAPLPAAGDVDYGMAGPDGTIHDAPGLGTDVRFIALIQAKVALDALRAAPGTATLPDGATVVLFGISPVEGLFPRALSSAILSVARQEGCLVCEPIHEARGEVRPAV